MRVRTTAVAYNYGARSDATAVWRLILGIGVRTVRRASWWRLMKYIQLRRQFDLTEVPLQSSMSMLRVNDPLPARTISCSLSEPPNPTECWSPLNVPPIRITSPYSSARDTWMPITTWAVGTTKWATTRELWTTDFRTSSRFRETKQTWRSK